MDALRKKENFLEENLKKLAEGATSFCEFNRAEPSGRKCGILLINGLNCQATFSSQWASQHINQLNTAWVSSNNVVNVTLY